MNIGQVIRALRMERGFTLEQVALEIGTDPSNLSRIERGVQQPASKSLRMIAVALGTTVSALHASAENVATLSKESPDLLGADETDYSEEAVHLRRQFRNLTPENQKIAVELLRALNRSQKSR